MQFELAEKSRVQSIRSRFENLTCLQSLNIASRTPNTDNDWAKPSRKFQFQRSATSIDFMGNRTERDIAKCKINAIKVPDDDRDILKPLKSENIELRFKRHMNDPVKRSSIKRSPAFRVGEKTHKNSSANNEALINNASENVDQSRGKQSIVGTKWMSGENVLTDTMKAVLKQPLPTGPPPKKPPRIFAKSRPSAQQMFEAPDGRRNVIRQKNIFKKEADFITRPIEVNKKTSKQLKNNFLKCSPCSYVAVDPRTDSLQRYSMSKVDMPTTCIVEHIYMEPFAHLKLNNSLSNNKIKNCQSHVPEKIDAPHVCHTEQATDRESFDSTLVSCTSCASDEHSLDFNHYMVSKVYLLILLKLWLIVFHT